MPSTMIDFRGDHGTPYAVYEGERHGSGTTKILRTIFVPHAAQVAFFEAGERYLLFHGNRGSGKSCAILWKAIFTALLIPGSRVAIFRKTWPELKRSIWDELLKLPKDLSMELLHSYYSPRSPKAGRRARIRLLAAEEEPKVTTDNFPIADHPRTKTLSHELRSDEFFLVICGGPPHRPLI